MVLTDFHNECFFHTSTTSAAVLRHQYLMPMTCVCSKTQKDHEEATDWVKKSFRILILTSTCKKWVCSIIGILWLWLLQSSMEAAVRRSVLPLCTDLHWPRKPTAAAFYCVQSIASMRQEMLRRTSIPINSYCHALFEML